MARPTTSAQKKARPPQAAGRGGQSAKPSRGNDRSGSRGSERGSARSASSRGTSRQPARGGAAERGGSGGRRGSQVTSSKNQQPPWLWPVVGGGGACLLIVLILMMSGGGDPEPEPTDKADQKPPTTLNTNKTNEPDPFAGEKTDPNWDPNNPMANRANAAAAHARNQGTHSDD